MLTIIGKILLYAILISNYVAKPEIIDRMDPKTFEFSINSNRYKNWLEPEPNNVQVSFRLISFGPVDEKKSQFTVMLDVYVSWNDNRLKVNYSKQSHHIEYLEINNWHLSKIWKPNLHFANAKPFTADILSDKLPGQVSGIIDSDGNVFISKKTKLDASCKFNTIFYPMDTQRCSIEIESSSLSTRYMNLTWSLNPVQIPSNFHWSDFDMKGISIDETRVNYKNAGPYRRLKATFKLRRHMSHYLFNVYLPSTLFVISSWSSFWIDIPAAPARVALVLTTMLTHVTSTKAIHDQLPKSLFVSSLDIWIIMCTMFIFAAIIEYSTVNYFYHKVSRIRDKKPPESKNLTQIIPGDENLLEPNNGDRSYTPITVKSDNCWHKTWTKIFPPFDQENFSARRTALLIDYRSRILFPIAFVLFNVFYWTILAIYSDAQK